MPTDPPDEHDHVLPDDLRQLRDAVWAAARSRVIHRTNVGYRFGRFEVFDCKRGGMGIVLEAWDTGLNRKVAIKLWINEETNANLIHEAQTLARLTSRPNIVAVFDIGEWNERHYFVMEWIDGQNARDWLEDAETPRTWREVRDLYVEAGRGLAEAHDAGIVHRDFKPSNVLVGAHDGRVCVADFGLAASIRSSDSTADTITGTPGYIAPERLRCEEGDERSDQFSFCVALWEALHGTLPYLGAGIEGVLAAIENYEVRTAKPHSDVPQWLSWVVYEGLHPDPDQRYPDMRALLRALTAEPPDGDVAGEDVEGETRRLGAPRYLHAQAEDAEVVDLLDAPSSAQRRSFRRIFSAGAAVGVLGTLIAVGSVSGSAWSPPQLAFENAAPLESMNARLTRWQLGVDKFVEARDAVDRGDCEVAFTTWNDAWLPVSLVTPELAGHWSLELARRVVERDPTNIVAGRIAAAAAKSFQDAEAWEQAVEARDEAETFFRAAGDEDAAARQARCATSNLVGEVCHS